MSFVAALPRSVGVARGAPRFLFRSCAFLVESAFIPGISGELFRQFAVTVAVSMFLSAINALTLSPALCAVLLRPHHGPRRGPIGALMRGIDWVRDGYGAIVARLVRISIIGLVFVAVSMAGIWSLGRITPTGFLPEDGFRFGAGWMGDLFA